MSDKKREDVVEESEESHGGGALLWGCNSLISYFFAEFWLNNPDVAKTITNGEELHCCFISATV